MIVLRKKIITIRSTEEFVKEFPGANSFMEKNVEYFQQIALDEEVESLFLQRVISMYLKEIDGHYFVFATEHEVFIFELNVDNVLVTKDKVMIMTGKKHLESNFTHFIFDRYKHHPMVKAMEKRSYTYETAMDIFNKIGDVELKIIEQL